MSEPRSAGRGVVVLLVVVILVLGLLLALYSIPLRASSETTSYGEIGSIGSGQPRVQVPVGTTCPPSNSLGNSTVSFVWHSNVTDLQTIIGFGAGWLPPGSPYQVLYEFNTTAGGYSASVGPDSLFCEHPWFVGFSSPGDFTVSFTLEIFHTSRTTVPLL